MTNKEAIEYGKKWDEAIESRGDTPFSEARQFLSLAIKALRRADCIYVKDECYAACGECGYCEAEEEGTK